MIMAENVNNGGNNGAAEMSKREKMLERMRGRYADRGFENEDDMYGAAMEDWDAMDGKIKASEEENAKAMAALKKSPAAMKFLSAILNDVDEAEALQDLEDYLKFSPEEKARHNENVAARQAAEEAAAELKAKYEENLAVTSEVLGKWAEENGLSVEEAVNMVNEFVEKFINKFNSGAMDKDFFEQMFRLMNYDKDIAAAREAGRKEGVNEGIKSKAEKKTGDGLPKVGGSGVAPAERTPRANNLLERLREANDQRGVLN